MNSVTGDVVVTGRSNTGLSYDVLTVLYDTNGVGLWGNLHDGGNYDMGYRVELNPATGDVYVGGSTNNGSNNDYLALKYDYSLGFPQWVQFYDNGGGEALNSLALDSLGSMVVTGWSENLTPNRDYTTNNFGP